MNIRVDLKTNIADGAEVVFRSPADCSQVTGLVIYHTGGKTEFAFADAHGHNVGDIDHLFAENAVVKVILDVTAGMAFVQNADTNAYIERTFIKSVNGRLPDENGNVEIKIPEDSSGRSCKPEIDVGSEEMPEGCVLQIELDDEDDDSGLTDEELQSIAQRAAKLVDVPTKEEIRDIVSEEIENSGGGIQVSGAKVGDFLKVAAVDEKGVPTAWETAQPPTGGEEVVDLLIDITTTERVKSVSQDIDNVAYKSIVAVVFAQGHADNNTSQLTLTLSLYNNEKEYARVAVAHPIYNLVEKRYSRTIATLTDKYIVAQSYSGVNSTNATLSPKDNGILCYEWKSNTLKKIAILISDGNNYNTMEVGATIKVWGVRA